MTAEPPMNLFRRVCAPNLAEESLRQAQIDLLQSEYYAEHYQSAATMLRSRIKRLEEYLAHPSVVTKLPTRGMK